jgi:ABC-type polysaccharide/polyol phosphate export permease
LHTAFGRHGTLRADGLCRHVTLDLLFNCLERRIEQPDKQREFDQQGLFPRLIVPTATVAVAFTDFLISFLFLVLLMAWHRFLPGWQMTALPAFVAFGFFVSVGPSLWITALNVKYGDFRYVIPFVVQFGLYVSPVGFSSSVIPQSWRLVYSLNSMVGVIDGFHWCMLGGQSDLYLPGLVASAVVTAFFVWFGIRRFRKMDKELRIPYLMRRNGAQRETETPISRIVVT